MTRREEADEREKATGMRQSTGAMTAKIAFGALFLISGLTTNWSERADVADPVASMLLSIVLGLALIAWGLIPRLKADKVKAAAAKAAPLPDIQVSASLSASGSPPRADSPPARRLTQRDRTVSRKEPGFAPSSRNAA